MDPVLSIGLGVVLIQVLRLDTLKITVKIFRFISRVEWFVHSQPLNPTHNPEKLHCNHSPGKRQIILKIHYTFVRLQGV